MNYEKELVTETEEVQKILKAIQKSGSFAIDLEFVSEDRYIPDLALVQLAWGDVDEPHVCAIDPLKVDLTALGALVASPDIEMIAHGSRQDLQIIAAEWGTEAQNFVDTQIAAAFAGIAEQIGYANLVRHCFSVDLDKGPQFTDWLRRPISTKQMAYALDDVRYLHRVWRYLKNELGARRPWVLEESGELALSASTPTPPEDMFLKIRGWQQLRDRKHDVLVALAAWREIHARENNKPPSWIISDQGIVDIAKRLPSRSRELTRMRSLNAKSIEHYGERFLEIVEKAEARPKSEMAVSPAKLTTVEQGKVAAIVGMIAIIGEQKGISPRLLGSRGDAEEALRSFGAGQLGVSSMMKGWRKGVIGELVEGWLEGRLAIGSQGMVAIP